MGALVGKALLIFGITMIVCGQVVCVLAREKR
jgi:hypothetical protein